MHTVSSFILVGLLLLLTSDATAQISAGMSFSTFDYKVRGTIVGPTPCATNFVFDWTPATGCNAITAVIP